MSDYRFKIGDEVRAKCGHAYHNGRTGKIATVEVEFGTYTVEFTDQKPGLPTSGRFRAKYLEKVAPEVITEYRAGIPGDRTVHISNTPEDAYRHAADTYGHLGGVTIEVRTLTPWREYAGTVEIAGEYAWRKAVATGETDLGRDAWIDENWNE
jgi:hypothetical protein